MRNSPGPCRTDLATERLHDEKPSAPPPSVSKGVARPESSRRASRVEKVVCSALSGCSEPIGAGVKPTGRLTTRASSNFERACAWRIPGLSSRVACAAAQVLDYRRIGPINPRAPSAWDTHKGEIPHPAGFSRHSRSRCPGRPSSSTRPDFFSLAADQTRPARSPRNLLLSSICRDSATFAMNPPSENSPAWLPVRSISSGVFGRVRAEGSSNFPPSSRCRTGRRSHRPALDVELELQRPRERPVTGVAREDAGRHRWNPVAAPEPRGPPIVTITASPFSADDLPADLPSEAVALPPVAFTLRRRP